MYLSTIVEVAALVLPMCAWAQFAASTTSDYGIFQLVTPTVHASQFSDEVLDDFFSDATDFYTSYTLLDSFNYLSALELAIESAAPHDAAKLGADALPLNTLYFNGDNSLIENPTAYLSRLKASAAPFPFAPTMVSQASALLLGYESLVSRDLLKKKNIPSVTPGMSISGSPEAATATATNAGSQPTSPSKALGIPVATGNPQLMVAAAAAAAGFLGIIAL